LGGRLVGSGGGSFAVVLVVGVVLTSFMKKIM